MKRKRVFGVSLLAVACSGEHLDLGHDNLSVGGTSSTGASGGTGGTGTGGTAVTGGTGGTGSGNNGASGPELPSWPAQQGCPTDPDLSDLVGIWQGQVEDFYLRPVKEVRLIINGASHEAGLCGLVIWGTRSAPPPPEDPDAVYPSSDYWEPFGVGGRPGYLLTPIDGFPYTIVNSGERLPTVRLATRLGEPWQSYCALQTPLYSGDSAWACTEQGHTTWIDLEPSSACTVSNANGVTTYTQFHCGACQGPSPFCVCNEESCGVTTYETQTFDLALSSDGMTLTGPFTWPFDVIAPEWTGMLGMQDSLSFHLERISAR
jgi:hypothetical protein